MRISDWSSDVCSSDLVDHSFLDRKRRQRLCDRLAEAAGPVKPAARDELHLALGDVRLKPVTVELDLVEPFLARGRLRHQRCKHRRSEEHTSELQSLMRISYAVFCLKKKTKNRLTR